MSIDAQFYCSLAVVCVVNQVSCLFLVYAHCVSDLFSIYQLVSVNSEKARMYSIHITTSQPTSSVHQKDPGSTVSAQAKLNDTVSLVHTWSTVCTLLSFNIIHVVFDIIRSKDLFF